MATRNQQNDPESEAAAREQAAKAEAAEAEAKAKAEADKAAADAKAKSEAAAREQAAPASTEPPTYVVAEGKVVTTLRGPMGAFQEVYARDFVHGQTDLDELVASGSLVAKKS